MKYWLESLLYDQAAPCAQVAVAITQVSPERRLGSGPTGATEIKQHKWFSRLDWQAMVSKTLPAPINPNLKNPLDTSNFDSFDAPEPPAVPAGKVDKNAHMWDLWDWIDEPSSQ